MSYPHVLTSLTPREAITDALYRAVIGFDRNDMEVFNSSFIGEEVTFEFKGDASRTAHDLTTIRNGVLSHVGPMDTTHSISNIRVDVKDGADTASLTCYALAQHCPPGRGKEPDGPKLLVGGEYLVDLVKDEKDGLWKIKKWVLDVIWRQGDRSVMQPSAAA
jgi:SnoaL-like domain